MPIIDQRMHIGNNCNGYDPVGTEFQSSIGTPFSKSCDNCHHFKDGMCEIDLYDKVLAGLDQL